MVTVSFDIDANEYEGRWFNKINAWGIMEYITDDARQANMAAAQRQETAVAEPQPTENKQQNAPTGDGNDGKEEKDDDLPF
jgi:type IV secretory pathway VirB9-like protein